MEIGNIKINFSVFPDFDTAYILVGDLSKWFGAENLPATIEITPPGSTVPIIQTFQKHKINHFNSTNLGLSCLTECGEQEEVPLKDGVWKITVKSGYTDIEKTRYFLKTDTARGELDRIYIKTELEYSMHDKQLREDLSDVEFLINRAESRAREGNFVKASNNFEMALSIIEKYQDCKNCI